VRAVHSHEVAYFALVRLLDFSSCRPAELRHVAAVEAPAAGRTVLDSGRGTRAWRQAGATRAHVFRGPSDLLGRCDLPMWLYLTVLAVQQLEYHVIIRP
jgi:hypothetical protein